MPNLPCLTGCRLLVATSLFLLPSHAQADPPYTRTSAPPTLTYQELVALGEQDPVAEPLRAKLDHLLKTPFVSNEAHYAGIRPVRPALSGLGPSLRVVFWNIERGLNLEELKLAFTDPEAFIAKARASFNGPDAPKDKKSDEDWAAVREQLEALRAADVIVLNEVDWGMKRTGYHAVIRELGEALKMNWAFGVEFVEVDPMVLGTEKFEQVEDAAARTRLIEETKADPGRLQGLHGNAVLSRYPIRDVRLQPFRNIGYDWYHGELNISKLEAGKRHASKLLGESLGREVRRGGRTNLIVTLDVPDLKEKQLTIAATHLENRADPKARRLQLEELLALLKPVRNPVIIAGDMNTTGSKGKPRNFSQSLLDAQLTPESIAKNAIKYGTGIGPIYSLSVNAYKNTRFQSDPTTPGIKPVAGNPEAAFFDALEAFRFDDGTTVDFRGDAHRSFGARAGTLANSNQRAAKGFVRTFQFERNIGPKGWLKLDWIFVKAYAEHPRQANQPYRFAPHFGRTLTRLNFAPAERISDHSPMTVDLPFGEPEAHQPNLHGTQPLSQ